MIERKKYRQQWTAGAIVQIDLGDGSFGYGQVLEKPSVVFFDYQTKGETVPIIEKIVKSPIVFKIAVMRYCITQDWGKIDKVSINPQFNEKQDKFTYDSITKKCEIWIGDGGRRSATLEECQNLEPVAVWEPDQVEQRLRDHFAGRPCYFVEGLKPGWEFIPIKEFYKQYGYDYIDEAEESKSLK